MPMYIYIYSLLAHTTTTITKLPLQTFVITITTLSNLCI